MNLVDYVNIDLGTNSTFRQSKGNTLPHVQFPFGRQSFIRQTDFANGGWFYSPHANYTEGIRISSQPSPWLGDYGHIVFMPISGEDKVKNSNRHSAITKVEQTPAYMQFYLTRYQIMTKFSPTLSGGICNIKYENKKSKKLVIDAIGGQNYIKVAEQKVKISTTNVPESQMGYHENFKKYYVFETSSKIISYKIYQNEKEYTKNEGQNLKVVLEFESQDVDIKICSSYISFEMASLSLQRELQKTLEQVKKEAQKEWNKYLGTIQIKEEEKNIKTFYSNMYRLFLYPRQVTEINEQGEKVYKSFKDGTIKKGEMISDVGFWDTYRTTMPLFRKIIPNKYKEIIRSILNFYEDYGWLPRWIAPFERGIMPSTLTDSVIAEAIVTKNVEEEKIPIAIKALLKDGEEISKTDLHGRKNLEDYKNLGYIPFNKTHESVSMTLDNCYSDYAIYKALESVGEHEKAKEYKIRSKNYKNLFNKQSLFFESKDDKGQFNPSYNPDTWGDDFCESSGWQNRFSVFHDFEGLIDLYGTKQKIEQCMDKLITSRANYKIGKYGFEIHEMTEMAICDKIGYLAISNQPSFHLPFVYLKLENEKKTRDILSKIFEYFDDSISGYPGDEDNGSLSAWYILCQIGLYPYCPVDGDFLEFEGFVNCKINQLQ